MHHIVITKDHPAKKINSPPRPPTELSGWIIPGTDFATIKSASQFAAVEIDAPREKKDRERNKKREREGGDIKVNNISEGD